MKTFIPLLLTVFLLAAPTPATAQMGNQAPTAVSQSDCADWVKRKKHATPKQSNSSRRSETMLLPRKQPKASELSLKTKPANKKVPSPDVEHTNLTHARGRELYRKGQSGRRAWVRSSCRSMMGCRGMVPTVSTRRQTAVCSEAARYRSIQSSAAGDEASAEHMGRG